MSRPSFSQVKKARRRAAAASGSNAIVPSKPQPFPELVELLPPDILQSLRDSHLARLDWISAPSVLREGSASISKAKERSGRAVIIKQTTITFDESDGRVKERDRLERFCREVRVLQHTAILYNDNVVDIVDMQWGALGVGQSLTIVLESADFGNLTEFQASHHATITWAHKKKLCLDVAAGLSMLHDCGIVHGDLKPENVLIFCGPTPSWEDKWDVQDGFLAKLCDFGSAHFDIWTPKDGQEHVSLHGATPPFTAPEYDFQNQGRIPCTLLSRFDIYVFGLVAWRIVLGGKVPLGVLAAPGTFLHDKDEIRWQQTLKRFPDDRFLRLAIETLSPAVPAQDQEFYTKIFNSTLRSNAMDRARTIKEMPCLVDPANNVLRPGREEAWSTIVAVHLPSGSAPDIFLQPTDQGLIGSDFGTMPEVFSTPNPALHSSIFQSLKSMAKDESLDHTKRAQANVNAGLCAFAGIGIEVSHQLALQYLADAASLGDVRVRAVMYRLHRACGKLPPESMPIATWLEDGIRSGSIIASEDLVRYHGASQGDHLMQWIRTHRNETLGVRGATTGPFSVCRSGSLSDILAASDRGTRCDESGATCLHYIVGHDHPDLERLVPALVASGSAVDSQSRHSFQQAFGLSHYGYQSKEGTPLHWAVARNSARAVTALLKAGADPYLRNPSELSPAHVASFNHQSDLLQIMLSCSKHTWNPPGRFKVSLMAQALSQTAFQHAICTDGDPRSLSRTLLLLRNGFETNGVYDAELLSTAIESRRTAVLEFLLDECHIDPNIGPVHTGGGASTVCWPLQIAVKSAHLPSFDLLVRHGLIVFDRAQLTWAVSSTASSTQDEIIGMIERLVLDLGFDVNRPDRSGAYPLHVAIDDGKTSVVERLLRLGADKERTCALQNGPPLTALGRLLHVPRLKAAQEILKLLLHPKEGMGRPSSHDVCPATSGKSLHVICSAPSSLRDDEVSLGCFRILWESFAEEERTAFLDMFDDAGRTPLHRAVGAGHFLCVEELVHLGADVGLRVHGKKQQTALDLAESLVSDRVLESWEGEPSDLGVYREQMAHIIRFLKIGHDKENVSDR